MYIYNEDDNRTFAAQTATRENYDEGFRAGIKEYEKRLLNKMFPYDVCDKKEYSINAYAVYKAITDVSKGLVGEG
jgi:hypothetical protein